MVFLKVKHVVTRWLTVSIPEHMSIHDHMLCYTAGGSSDPMYHHGDMDMLGCIRLTSDWLCDSATYHSMCLYDDNQ